MNDKINRGQLVRTYIGEGLAPFKFEYKGYHGDSWKFERNMKGAVQTISIYPYRFDQSMITFELYTNVKNSEYASKIGTNVVSASMLDGIVSNGQIRGYWQYGNEQELIQVLGEMKDVLIKKGMKILVELSKGLEEPDTAEMYREVYFHHDELCEKFMEKTGIVVTGFDEENIDRWFEVIEERTAILKQGDYEDAKEELMEIAAFLGNQLVKYLGGRWFHYLSENHESCGVEGCKTLNPGLNCLSVVVGGYTENGMNWVKKSIVDMCENRRN